MIDLGPVGNQIIGRIGGELGLKFVSYLAENCKELPERVRERLDSVFGEAFCMLSLGQITPEVPPDKLLFPIMEGASLEDDETLQKKWAGLLASALDPASRPRVHPSFQGILRSLSPQEALFLNKCFEKVDYVRGFIDIGELPNLMNVAPFDAVQSADYAHEAAAYFANRRRQQCDIEIVLDRLSSHGLIARKQPGDIQTSTVAGGGPYSTVSTVPEGRAQYMVTASGAEFCLACTGPQPKL